eukprot:541049-Pyramimonas_sp.AAC.1
MLIEESPGRAPGSWISRAIWLCLAPHCLPLLRPVLQVRGLNPRPCEIIARWLPLAGVHAPADLALRLGTDAEVTGQPTYATLDNEHITILLRRLGGAACYTQNEANKM